MYHLSFFFTNIYETFDIFFNNIILSVILFQTSVKLDQLHWKQNFRLPKGADMVAACQKIANQHRTYFCAIISAFNNIR